MKSNYLIKKIVLFPVLAIIAGVIASYGYAPHNLWYMPIIGVSLLAYILTNKRSLLGNALIVFLFAFTLNTTTLWWISSVLRGFGQMPFILATLVILCLSIYLAIFQALAGLLSKKFYFGRFIQLVIFLPFLWVAADYLNGVLFTGFPWNWLCYTQTNSHLKHIAPIFGGEGVTLAVLMIGGAIGYAIKTFRFSVLCLPITIYTLAIWLSTLQFTDKLTNVNVSLMQGNIPTEAKWNQDQIIPTLKTYFKLVEGSIDKADIIIWPESAIPALENDTYSILDRLDNLMYSNHVGFITGLQYFDERTNSFYNGMVGLGLIDAKGINHYTYGEGNRYYKRHLVPIGEFVPFETLLRTLGPIFNMPMSSFTRGNTKQPNIEIFGLKIASAICYEIAFNFELIDQIYPDTNMIVTLSNDGWFNLTNGPSQHLAIAQMRAIEFGKPVLRATNNGITAAINDKGEIIDTAMENIITTLNVSVTPTLGLTPFATYGRKPMLYVISFLLFLGIFSSIYQHYMRKKHQKQVTENLNPSSENTKPPKEETFQ